MTTEDICYHAFRRISLSMFVYPTSFIDYELLFVLYTKIEILESTPIISNGPGLPKVVRSASSLIPTVSRFSRTSCRSVRLVICSRGFVVIVGFLLLITDTEVILNKALENRILIVIK